MAQGQEAEEARCRAEIADARQKLLAGHPDVEGLCMQLADWAGELRILEHGRQRTTESED